MKKQKLSFLITFMLIALVGIIVVQLFWIKNAVEVRKEQFDNRVNKALEFLVQQVEQNESERFIKSKIDAVVTDSVGNIFISSSDTVYFNGDSSDVNEIQPNMIIIGDSASWQSNSTTVEINTNIRKAKQKSITLNIDSDKQGDITTVVNTTDTAFCKTDTLQKSINIQKTILSKDSKLQSFDYLIKKLVIEYDTVNYSIEERLNIADFKKRVQKSLIQFNIPYPFSYHVVENDSIITSYGKSVDPGEAYFIKLFPKDTRQNNVELHLDLHGVTQMILKSLVPLMLLSLLFSLLMLFVFYYSLRTIYKQKKIARIKTDFINNMTHEFKTPVATIALAVDSIEDEKVLSDKEKVKYFTGMIRKENRRMNQQVENVLQMACLEKGELSLKMKPLALHEIINNVCRTFELQIKQKNIKLDLMLDSEKDMIQADEDHLLNVIQNLLDNAIKYSSVNAEIHISSTITSEKIFLSIKDNGMGMSKEQLKHIFDPFYRGQTGNIHDVKGFGLGLSYVKSVLQLMNAEINVNSIPHEGSEFVISFDKINSNE